MSRALYEVPTILFYKSIDILLCLRSLACTAYFVGTQNTLDTNSTEDGICDNTKFLVLDCDTCSCCDVCCEGKDDGICDIHMSPYVHLGLECGTWWMYCGETSSQYDVLPVAVNP